MSATDRTAERRAALVEVAYELVGREGMAGTTVRRVCEAARLNPRYFYESFADLDALVVAVFDHVAEEAFKVMIDAVAASIAREDDLEQVTRVAIRAFIEHLAEDPRRARVLFVEGFTNEALGIKRFDTMHDLVESLLADARAKAVEETGTDKLPSLVIVASNLFVGGMAELLVSWAAGRVDVSLDELVEDSVALFLAIARFLEERGAGYPTAGGADPAPADLAHRS